MRSSPPHTGVAPEEAHHEAAMPSSNRFSSGAPQARPNGASGAHSSQVLQGEPLSQVHNDGGAGLAGQSTSSEPRASQVASRELARRFGSGPKGMVLHIGPFAGPSVDNGRKVCPVCTMTIPEDVTWTDHVLTERHLQAVGDPLPHAQYYCYICSAIVSGDDSLTLHVEGAHHRRNLEIGKRCGVDGCEMLLFTEADLSTHRDVCHDIRARHT